MAKKMSIEEILAAARANKAAGGATPAPQAEKPAEAAAPAAETPAAAEAPVSDAPAEPAKKVPPGGKGMSMAEILAAARAGKAGGAAAKPAAAAPKPVAEKPAAVVAEKQPIAEKKPGPAAVTEKDTASILAAARKGAKPGPVSKAEAAKTADPVAAGKPAKVKIEVPPMPARPAFRPQAAPADDTSRRTFLATFGAVGAYFFGSGLAVGFTTLAATTVAWTLGLARFMFPNILIEPPTRFKVGFPDNLGPGQVETKFIPQFGVWIVKYEFEGQPMIYALKSVCTHLGCTPNWLEAEQKFKCPCHGSGFYKDGVNFEGPAPRPLERYAISIADDGQLEVDKSRTFNQETGQWADTASFVPV